MPNMLRRLRLQLTLLYMLVALAFIGLLGGGTYQLLANYFQQTTDLGLQHKMAHEFRLLGAPLPSELISADRDWFANRDILFPHTTASESRLEDRARNLLGANERYSSDANYAEQFYDGELSAIFVLPLNAQGERIFDPNPYTPPLPPDQAAAAAALEHGVDWRTIRLENGTAVRLLTYRLTRDDGPALLQLGRAQIDQERILNQLLLILVSLGSVSAVMLGAGSWWLAGRSLVPAQQAWERQQTFVANASHELRTPLTLIRSSAEAVLRRLPEEPQRQRRLVQDIVGESDHLTRMIQDLLLLSRLDARRLDLEHTTVDLPTLLADLERQVGPLAEAQQIRLEVSGATGAVWGDPTRLRQVLLILLDNALRHTPAGGTIAVRVQSRPKQMQIEVCDTGSGIPAADLPRVFERFYRADPARTGGTGGTGLGLAIASMLVEAQHGQITLTSKEGEGTQVTLTLPVVA